MPIKSLTTLERILIETVCTETAGDMEPVTCACGTPNALTTERGLVKHGRILGATVVAGCRGPDGDGCPVPSQFGNLAWEYRHGLARFLRAMADQLLRDRTQLLGELPPEMGES